MNRGKRRGGISSGFASLRDGVKRRLFDPFAVPVTPDPQTVIARLIPLPFTDSTKPHGNAEASQNCFNLQLFATKAVTDYAFEYASEKRRLSGNTKNDGLMKPATSCVSGTQSSLAHLLMKTDEIAFWNSGVLTLLSKPSEWYPSELTGKLKRKSSTVHGSTKRVRFSDPSSGTVGDSTSEFASNEMVLDPLDRNEDDDEDALRGVGDSGEAENQEDRDSEDERWNGEPVTDEGEEEEGNDYCETYFDNGEGDIDDFNVQIYEVGEDPDHSSYYD